MHPPRTVRTDGNAPEDSQLVDGHLRAFLDAPRAPQGAVGYAPVSWANRFRLADVPDAGDLPNGRLSREELYAICRDRPILHAYVCVMAWGLQGAVPGSGRNVQAAWANRGEIESRIRALRSGTLGVEQAYDLFRGERAISGLGPSYFSKLLHFFFAGRSVPILDQWTARSVNLIAGRPVVRMAGHYPSPLNTGREYVLFCQTVERIAARAAKAWGFEKVGVGEVETHLFGRGGPKPSPWRAYVKSHSS